MYLLVDMQTHNIDVAEIFPLRARAKGVALSAISHWVCEHVMITQ